MMGTILLAAGARQADLQMPEQPACRVEIKQDRGSL